MNTAKCQVHDPDDVVPGRICGRYLPCKEHNLPKPSGEAVVLTGSTAIEPREGNVPGTPGQTSGGLSASPDVSNRSEWLTNVLAHCDRARATSLATMKALGKSSSKVRKAVAK